MPSSFLLRDDDLRLRPDLRSFDIFSVNVSPDVKLTLCRGLRVALHIFEISKAFFPISRANLLDELREL